MSDPWQSPAGVQPPQQPAQFGAPVPAAAPPVWAPPPKPGLIPLRPLTLGTILGAAFQVMRRNPRPTFGISLVLNAAIYVVFGLFVAGFAALAFGRIESASAEDQGSIIAGSVLGGGLALLVPLAASLTLSAILQGIISLEVARGTVAEKYNTRGLLRFAKGRLGALVGWSMLVAATVLVAALIVTLVVSLLIAFGGVAGTVIGILLAVAFCIVFAVAAVWIGTKLSLVPSALLLERLPLRRAIARSWTLTNRSFWKTFGIQLLVNVIVSTASQIITFPISLIFSILSAIVSPTGDPESAIGIFIVMYVVLGVVSLVIGAIGVVMQSATSALIYIDLRMRSEGLDLELMRFVEARQSGDTSVPDPYLPHTSAAPATPATVPWG